MLGLGDIAVPGAFIAMLRQYDLESFLARNPEIVTTISSEEVEAIVQSSTDPEQASLDVYEGMETPYYVCGITAYAVGLGTTFVANSVTGQGELGRRRRDGHP